MKKVIIWILIIGIVIISTFFTWYNKNLQKIKEVKIFNNQFEGYLEGEINGVDLTTVINKALENNIQYEIEKDSKGVYKNDGQNSIKIMIKPSEEGNSFPMEAFEIVGISDFTKNFGSAIFKVTNIEYHKNGRISKIEYEIQSTKNSL